MALIGIITGDIVGSTNIVGENRDLLLSLMKDLLAQNSVQGNDSTGIFRGDSFQIMMPYASSAVKTAISIRSGLMFKTPTSFSSLWDARISIGIGPEEYIGENVGTSDGEAFRLSGRNLDEMKNSRLAIHTQIDTLNDELAVEVAFVDDIISHWTRNQAFVVHQFCGSYPPSRQEIAKQLMVSPQRVNQLYHSSKMPLLLPFFDRFESLIKSIIL